MARQYTRADGLLPADLAHFGIDHLTAAQALFDTDPSHYDSAGYLYHMGAELLLKAWLLEVAGAFTATHSLAHLHRELKTKHGAPELDAVGKRTLAALDEFSELRYPDRRRPIEIGGDHLPGIKSLMRSIQASLPSQLVEDLEKVVPGRKGGRVLMVKRS